MNQKLVLIDGHAIIHRAYHAFPVSLTTRQGELVNAVYGFTRILLGVIADLKPEYLAVAFDLPTPTFRHQEYLGYQHKRPAMEEKMRDQIGRVHEVVQALNIPIFTAEGYEADDVIGTLAKQAGRNLDIIIVTGDRDIFQLINDRVRVYAPIRGMTESQFFDRGKVVESLGINPEQIIDYKALVGDSSDNYPGVPGIGPKTATKLLNQYRTLDNVYNHLEEIEPKVAQKLKSDRELAYLSKKLATIVTDAPVKLKLADCVVKDYDPNQTIKLFTELGFRSLLRRLPGHNEKDEQEVNRPQMKLI